MLSKSKLLILLSCCFIIGGCGNNDEIKETQYLNELAKYTDNSSNATLDNGILTYQYDNENQRSIQIDVSGNNENVNSDDSQSSKDVLESDSTDNEAEKIIEEKVKEKVIEAFNVKAADAIIDVASQIENSNKIDGIAVNLAKDDRGNHEEGDHIEELDVSCLKLDDLGLESLVNVDNSMIRIHISTNMSDEEFRTYSNKLKNKILEEYGMYSFHFSITRI